MLTIFRPITAIEENNITHNVSGVMDGSLSRTDMMVSGDESGLPS